MTCYLYCWFNCLVVSSPSSDWGWFLQQACSILHHQHTEKNHHNCSVRTHTVHNSRQTKERQTRWTPIIDTDLIDKMNKIFKNVSRSSPESFSRFSTGKQKEDDPQNTANQLNCIGRTHRFRLQATIDDHVLSFNISYKWEDGSLSVKHVHSSLQCIRSFQTHMIQNQTIEVLIVYMTVLWTYSVIITKDPLALHVLSNSDNWLTLSLKRPLFMRLPTIRLQTTQSGVQCRHLFEEKIGQEETIWVESPSECRDEYLWYANSIWELRFDFAHVPNGWHGNKGSVINLSVEESCLQFSHHGF